MRGEQFDCIVLGAGIAGLSAAQELAARGLSVVVLESRNRVGGRLHTVELTPGLPVDLGGAWIHGLGSPSSLNAIYALALRCGLQVRTTDYEDAVFYDTAYQPLGPRQVSRLGASFSGFAAFVAGMVARDGAAKTQLSVDDAVGLYAAAQGGLTEADMTELLFQVHNEIESYWAADGSSMSIGTMDEVRLPGADALLCGGYGQLIERLAAGLDVRAGVAVTRVAWTPAPSAAAVASCHTASGTVFQARRVVITLPLGVLKAGGVEFDPPLAVAAPAKALAVQRLGAGMYNKVMLVFEEAFWDLSVMIHRIPPQEERGRWAWILNLHAVMGAPVLVAFTTGSFALQMEQLPDEQVGEQLLQVLRKMYPGKVPAPRQVLCTRWCSDPHSRGSYTYIPVGADARDCEALRQPLADQLFFAGEATSRLFFGTVHGAYSTGLQAAEEVAAAEGVEGGGREVRAWLPGAGMGAGAGRKLDGRGREPSTAGEGMTLSDASGHLEGGGGGGWWSTGGTHTVSRTGGTVVQRLAGGLRASSSVRGMEAELSLAGPTWTDAATHGAAWSVGRAGEAPVAPSREAVAPGRLVGAACAGVVEGAGRWECGSAEELKERGGGSAAQMNWRTAGGAGEKQGVESCRRGDGQEGWQWGAGSGCGGAVAGGGGGEAVRKRQGCSGGVLLERSPAVGCSHKHAVISRL